MGEQNENCEQKRDNLDISYKTGDILHIQEANVGFGKQPLVPSKLQHHILINGM